MRVRPHVWKNGECVNCGMRSHWAGAQSPCEYASVPAYKQRYNERRRREDAEMRRKRAIEIAKLVESADYQLPPAHGTPAIYLAHKIREQRSDVFALILQGHYTTIRQAAVDAGIRRVVKK